MNGIERWTWCETYRSRPEHNHPVHASLDKFVRLQMLAVRRQNQ